MNAIQMKGITKRFGPLVANNNIDFDLKQGEIHALLGENGAGKTTLMRILYGLYSADEGEILVNEKPVQILSPKEAIANGIGMVSQHFTLVPPLSVSENIVLGYNKGVRLDPKIIQKNVADASKRFGVEVNPTALVRHLSVGERQRVEILKALYRNARVLIMDEPTAVLIPQEVDVLFESLERLRKEGLSVIFISHKLYEVMTICDRITVLRNGECIGTVNKSDTTERGLANMMVGRDTFGVLRDEERCSGVPYLRLENVTAEDKKGLAALKGISLEVCENEILGIAGVSGNGQTELTQVLSGTLKPSSGKILAGDKDITNYSPDQITKAGIGRIPEDRHGGVVGDLTVAENMALEHLDEFIQNGVLNRKMIQQKAEKLIKEYQIKASPSDHIRTLSGGNMQKVILARALAREPKFVMASQPTRGLDVGASEYVRKKLLDERKRGAAVMLLSEDLEEVMALSDRIAVIYEGRIVGIIPAEEATKEKLGLMMTGAREVQNA
ncbi:MAG: ABC transporter ATP-binding protein [Anaerolineaceae bacterium]